MAILKFDLDVIGSTCIRRKKPWPRLAIVGEVCICWMFEIIICLLFLMTGHEIHYLMWLDHCFADRTIITIAPLLSEHCFRWWNCFLQSVFLLDAQRISVLYMKSGKTKRQITKLQPLLKNVVQMTASDRGNCSICVKLFCCFCF